MILRTTTAVVAVAAAAGGGGWFGSTVSLLMMSLPLAPLQLGMPMQLTAAVVLVLGSTNAVDVSAFMTTEPHRRQYGAATAIIMPSQRPSRRSSSSSLQRRQHATEDPQNEFTTGRTLSKKWLPPIALVTLVSMILSAKIGLLPGPPLTGVGAGTGIGSTAFGPYTDAMIGRDVACTVLAGTLGYLFVQANGWLAANGYVEPRDSRKIIHTFSAPLFLALFPLFSPAWGARVFAFSVSLINAIRLVIAGSGGDQSLAFSVSRSGDQREALGGPFLYLIILMSSILLFWRDSPVGIVAVSAMAGGDGLADLFGRRYGKNNKWWFNPDKSMAGTLAFWMGGTITAWCLLQLLSVDLPLSSSFSSSSFLLPSNNNNNYDNVSPEFILLCGIMLITSILEVIPWKLDDNWVVPLSAAVLTLIAFE